MTRARNVTANFTLLPVMLVTPASQSFGSVTINTTNLLAFTVQNSGGGVLTGNVSGIAVPFSIVGGTNYVLTGGASTNVMVRFVPGSAATFSNNAAFNSTAGNLLRPMTGTATNPPAGVVQFATNAYSVAENGGAVTVTVVRVSGNFGSVNATYATTNETAFAEADYAATNGMLSWANGDAVARTIVIRILNDTVYESNETFSVRLGGMALGSFSNTTVTIVDDDPAPARIIGLSGNLAFGNVKTGTTATVTMTITNSGNSALTVTGIDYPTGFGGAWSSSIAAGKATDVTVTFAPVALATYGGMITVSSDNTAGSGTIICSGTGITVPEQGVWILSPTNGAILQTTTVHIIATANDSDGLSAVRFYKGTNLIGATNLPIGCLSWSNTFVWSNAPFGTNFLTARAFDLLNNTSTSMPVVLRILQNPGNNAPWIQIATPTTASTYTSMTNYLNIGGAATDDVSLVSVTVRNNRDVAPYACNGTVSWHYNGLPLYQGANYIDVVASDAAGNSATDTIQIAYSGDARYDDVLRSGGIVQNLTIPESLTPGAVVPVQWKILSYVPVRCRMYARDPARTWTNMVNGTYVGYQDSSFNLYGRQAGIYSFTCNWSVPQKSGTVDIWFNAAQMDGDQYMMPMIPDGVDLHPHPTVSKVVQRTILPGGDNTAPQSDSDIWDSGRMFESVPQHQARSAATITSITCPDNVATGSLMTCDWKVLSYLPVDAQVLLVDIPTTNIYSFNAGTLVGSVNTTYSFQDRITGQNYSAVEYTYRASFSASAPPGVHALCFRNRKQNDGTSQYMFGNISIRADSTNRPATYNGMCGRFVERTIVP